MLKRRTKAQLAAMAAKEMIEHPGVRQAATSVATPIAKRKLTRRRRRALRRGRKQAKRLSGAARALANYGPAADALGLQVKQKETAPRVAVGVVIGAGTMYLLEPQKGGERRRKLGGLLARLGGLIASARSRGGKEAPAS